MLIPCKRNGYFCRVKKNRAPIVLEDILIENYAAEGKSLARLDGKVIFVENAVPGDRVDIRLGKNKKDWAEGHVIAYRKLADNRVTPFCSHFGVCGGCQWQMLPYENQIQYKQQQITDQLSRIGKVELPPIQPIIGASVTTEYRNKLEYTFADKRFIPFEEFRSLKAKGIEIPESSPTGGFHAKGVFDKVVGIDTCHLQAEPTNEIRNFVVEFCKKHQYPFYNIKSHEGWLRNMMVRLATTGELMINLVVGFDNKKMKTQLLDAMLEKFPAITTLLYTVNTKFNDSMFGLVPQTYFGKGHIIEQLRTKDNAQTYSFKISPKSFFQTNTKQAEKLYRVTAAYAELTGKETVYDLYCGTGSIGIFVSDKAKKIIGVEQVEEAIIDAKENAALNNITHSFFTAGDVIDICNDDFFATHGKPDVVITDPPRAGMHEKLVQKLLDIAAPLIVYVSCNPATQARDLALLSEKYDVTALQPVDMFPHTHHIENVAQLKLRN